MKAMLKGTGTIYRTSFTQDKAGGRVEQKEPVMYNVSFVGKQNRRFEGNLPGKEGTRAFHTFWCSVDLDLTEANLTESGWLQFGDGAYMQCYDIQAITLVNDQSNRYGFEIETQLRK